ncbi:MAG: hypothetical protein EON59_01120 [Alphaproteobacteria bacterium]|nr:MAG: hypothetical protein EON59_01120 [Alphaproteobacteria bacterium]
MAYVDDTALAGTGASQGANIVGYKQMGTSAVNRTAMSKMRETVHVADFGAKGDYSTDDTVAIQAAINACPAGGTVLFDGGFVEGQGGDYKVTSTLNITRHVNLEGKNSRIVGVMRNTATDLIRVQPAAEIRNWTCRGLVLSFNSNGRDALSIGNGTVGFLHAIIESCNINSGAGGFGIRFSGVGTHLNTVRNCVISGTTFAENAITKTPERGGIMLAGADGTQIYDNELMGKGCGIVVGLVNGSFKTEIVRNAIVSRDVGVYLNQAQQVDIVSNQFEQGLGNQESEGNPNYNKATYKGHVVVFGSGVYSSGEEVRDCIISRNNFGNGSNGAFGVYLVAYSRDNVIDENYFASAPAGGADIYIGSPTVLYTRIGNRNRVGGVRAGIARGSANSIDPKTLLLANDFGTGTYGYAARKTPVLASGYTGSAQFAVWKDEDDRLVLDGSIVVSSGATVTPGTTILTLPDGMRPADQQLISVPNTVSPNASMLIVNTNGTVTSGSNVNANSTLFVGAASSITIRGRVSYLSGPF